MKKSSSSNAANATTVEAGFPAHGSMVMYSGQLSTDLAFQDLALTMVDRNCGVWLSILQTKIAARTLRVVPLSDGFGAMAGMVVSNIAMIGAGMGDAMMSVGIIIGSVATYSVPKLVDYSLNSGDDTQ